MALQQPLLQSHPPTTTRSINLKLALGAAGLALVTLATRYFRPISGLFSPNVIAAASSMSSPGSFVPKDGISSVLLSKEGLTGKPNGPVSRAGLRFILPNVFGAHPTCLFIYGKMQKSLDLDFLEKDAKAVQPACIYGAKVDALPIAYPLAAPTGEAADVIKGTLFCYADQEMFKKKREVADQMHGYDPSNASKGTTKSIVVSAVKSDGSVEQAQAYVNMYRFGAVRYKLEDFPPSWPYSSRDFLRADESSDLQFYDAPRLVYHIDEWAISKLTHYYDATLPVGADILDMCSSWVSHLPERRADQPWGRVAGMGMNEVELKKNPVLTEYTIKDLNVDPKLPYGKNEFDAVLNVVSIDYLNKPVDILAEAYRVLKPGGRVILSFSNRMFWTKAVAIWLTASEKKRPQIAAQYIHFSAPWQEIEAYQLLILGSNGKDVGDPMWVVTATKPLPDER